MQKSVLTCYGNHSQISLLNLTRRVRINNPIRAQCYISDEVDDDEDTEMSFNSLKFH